MNKVFNAVSVLIGAMMVLGLVSPASAGSAEDRIRDLEGLILSQQAQIKDLHVANQSIIVELNDLRYQAAQPVIPPKMTSSGSDKVKLKVYGQVNRALLWYDDGSDSDLRHVDNDASSTRIGFEGKATATDDLKVGGKVEVQFESNSSGDIGQADNTAVGTNSFTQRKLELYLTSKSWGKFSIGQGSTASDGASERNLSGVSLATGGSAPSAMGGALQFASPGSGALSGIAIDDVYSNQDGLSRDDRLRWDSPSINGFNFSTSAVDGGEADVGLSYGGEFPGFELEAKVAYANKSGTSTFPEEVYAGSASMLFDNGLNVTFAAAEGDDDDSSRASQNFWYTSLGYKFKGSLPGESMFAVDYGKYEDDAAAGDTATTWSVGLVQKVKDWGAEFYGAYRQFDLDRPGTDLDELSVAIVGTRVKF